MTEIAIRNASITEKIAYSDNLACSNMLPKQFQDKPANVLWAIEYGETLGIAPMAAITGIHVIENKPSASAALIGGLVRRAGHKLRVTGNNQRATAQIVRADDPDYTFEVTWELKRNQNGNPNAEDAGLLGKQVWKNYPAAMLKSRAITQVARDACEEVLFGLHYTPEELGAETDAEGNPLEQRTVRQYAQTADDPWATAPAATAQKVAEAEYAEEVEADPEPPRATAEQLNAAIGGVRAVRGLTDPVAICAAVSEVVGRPVPSPGELTAEEANLVVSKMREEQKAKTAQERQESERTIAPNVPPTYVSGAQLTALKDLLSGDLGIDDRTAQLAWCAAEVGRQLGALKDLTVDEAERLLRDLAGPQQDNAPLMDRLTTAMRDAQTSDELADVSELMWTEHEAGNLSQADVSKLQDISLKRESEITTTGKAAA